MPKTKKYKRNKKKSKKAKKKIKNSIYKSNVNKIKVNISNPTPSSGGSISHMHVPNPVPVVGTPYNFTELNTSLKSLENVIKQNQQQQQQQQTRSNQQQQQTQSNQQPKQNNLYNLEAKNQNVNPLSQFIRSKYPEKKYEETKSDKEDMAHDIVDNVIDHAVNYNKKAIDKLKIYDTNPDIINSDDYEDDLPQKKSYSSPTPKNKNWHRNRALMIKNLNDGKNVKQSTKDKYKPNYDKNTRKWY